LLEEGKFTTRSGVELHYMEQTSYNSDLKPILIVPALPESAIDYKDIVYILENHTIAFTHRGREQSDAPESGYSIKDHANDIIDCIEHFKLEELLVIAYSRGVSYFLEALPSIKNKIIGFILIDYPALYEKHPADWSKKYLHQSWRAMPIKERFPKEWVLERIELESQPVELWNNLKGIKCPVALFIGGKSYSDPVLISSKMTKEYINKYKKFLPQVKIVEFEDSGHDLRLWQYEKFVAELKIFIQETTAKVIAEKNQNKSNSQKMTFFGFDKEKKIKLN
jgi:pimeloyl-ACP methyl ester carboxylesterase